MTREEIRERFNRVVAQALTKPIDMVPARPVRWADSLPVPEQEIEPVYEVEDEGRDSSGSDLRKPTGG